MDYRLTSAEHLIVDLNFQEEYLSLAIPEWDSLLSFVGQRNSIFNFLSSKWSICGNQRGLCLQRPDYETACASAKSDTGMAPEVLSRVF